MFHRFAVGWAYKGKCLKNYWTKMGFSRRQFFTRMAGLAGGAALMSRLDSRLYGSSPSLAIPVRYTDVARKSGINFLQDSTTSPEKYYLETMGTGLGWIDYNQDGLYDLFLVQSSKTPAYAPAHPLRCALYRN
ncbi:MAG: hypothetical protein ACRD19_02905, partial [Terriglobia bacterium]